MVSKPKGTPTDLDGVLEIVDSQFNETAAMLFSHVMETKKGIDSLSIDDCLSASKFFLKPKEDGRAVSIDDQYNAILALETALMKGHEPIQAPLVMLGATYLDIHFSHRNQLFLNEPTKNLLRAIGNYYFNPEKRSFEDVRNQYSASLADKNPNQWEWVWPRKIPSEEDKKTFKWVLGHRRSYSDNLLKLGLESIQESDVLKNPLSSDLKDFAISHVDRLAVTSFLLDPGSSISFFNMMHLFIPDYDMERAKKISSSYFVMGKGWIPKEASQKLRPYLNTLVGPYFHELMTRVAR